MHPIALEARKERAWNSPEARRRRDEACAKVNEETAGQLLRELNDRELEAHIDLLDAEHKIKRAALQASADALARSLHERWLRTLSR